MSDNGKTKITEDNGRRNVRIIKFPNGKMFIADEKDIEIEDENVSEFALGKRFDVDLNDKTIEVREIITHAVGGVFDTNQTPRAYRPNIENKNEILDDCYRLWKFDALGGAIVNITTFFTYGKGMTLIVDNDIEKAILQKFWEKNDLDVMSTQISDEGTAYGNHFWKLQIHKEDVFSKTKKVFQWKHGQTEFIPIDPKNIYKIKHDPANVNNVDWYGVQYAEKEEDENGDVKRTVIKTPKVVPSLRSFDHNVDDSAMIHIKFNAATNDLFGLSDLVRVKEWIDNYSDFLRDGVEINKLYRSPCYDITIKDADDSDIRKAIRRYQDFEIGSNPVHNDKEVWQILEFRGANVSQEDNRRALLLMVAAGVNFAEFMFADASNANLASSKTQLVHVIRKFQDRQEKYRLYWKKVFKFVLDMALVYGGYSGLKPELDIDGDPIWNVDVEFPVIVIGDEKDIAESNKIGLESGVLSIRTARARVGSDHASERKRGVVEKIEAIDDAVIVNEYQIKKTGKAVEDIDIEKQVDGQSDTKKKKTETPKIEEKNTDGIEKNISS